MKVVVGQGSCGIATGAKKTAAELEKQIAAKGLDVKVDITGCVGTCYLEPIVDVYDDNGEMTRYVKVQPDKVAEIVESHLVNHKVCQAYAITPEDEQFLDKQQRVVLRNCGKINPENIDEYLAVDGYKAIEKVLKTMKPEEVIEEIKISGLRGRGGAGFPTWFKWNAAKSSPGKEKYLVCNADEGDPGAFMDRSVLEGDPHSLLEGMIIGGYAMGASQGVIYCRAEYPLAIKRLEIAMAQARERGYLGKNIFGSGFDFDIYIKAGAGAFVCTRKRSLDHLQRWRCFRQVRNRSFQGYQGIRAGRQDQEGRFGRGSDGHDFKRSPVWHRRRHQERQTVQGGADGRTIRRLYSGKPDRHAGYIRRYQQDRRDCRLRRYDRYGRRYLHG